MKRISLGELIESLERGSNLHICVAFFGECGNRKTRLADSQVIHNKPVCLAIKKLPDGLKSCYRCRNVVQKAVVQRRKSMAGFCPNGVYEYCRPVVYEDRVICVIYVGNILLENPCQRTRLEARVDSGLLETMDGRCTPEDCVKIADVLESYITFLFDHYGIESDAFDPLIENVKNYIRGNIEYGFSMEELAAAFNYTPKYMGQIFKMRTGKSVKEYCNQLKIGQAKQLLADTDLNMENIALRVGFNSVTYFDKVFHKLTGLSPQNYRATVKNKGTKNQNTGS